uniref:clp protease proteolytic subunit n=1 Tax=Ceratocephala orthoceras TaxID=286838 RepID=UPI0030E49067
MPIGVPRVCFRLPGDEEETWIDIYNRLYRQRIFFVGKRIDSMLAGQIGCMFVYLNIDDKTMEFFMYINSPGGGVIGGMSIYDAMQTVEADVTTICFGKAVSIASFILHGGEIGKRLAFTNSKIMIHQPGSDLFICQSGEYLLENDGIFRLRDLITRIYAQRTGKSYEVISSDLNRDEYMSAQEAIKYGIIDDLAIDGLTGVINKPKPIVEWPKYHPRRGISDQWIDVDGSLSNSPPLHLSYFTYPR